MTAVCDMCRPGLGDHDRPYEFKRPDHMRLRFTPEELRALVTLRRHVRDVKSGYPHGPGSGDLAPDPRDRGEAA